MKRRLIPLAALAVAATTIAGHAGEVRDFETEMRAAYADYRQALFATNSGKAEQSGKAIAAFRAAWAGLDAGDPPPQYQDDPGFSGTVDKVAAIAEEAATQVAGGDLPGAHETLEGIRDQIGDLHARNGLIDFSDRMNAYHARMEEVIGMPPGDPAAVAEQAAILGYLSEDLATHPPADADASFGELLAAVTKSVDALQAAARSGDKAAIKSAFGGLKVPYSKLFLKFG
jgi:hypothetical protein